MSYTPKYTSEEDIESLTQMAIDTNTHPTTTEVLNWIEDLENELDDRLLGWDDGGAEGDGYIRTDVYLDVIGRTPYITPIERFKWLAKGHDPYWHVRGAYIPLEEPIVDITSLAIRTTDLQDLPSWTDLTQGYYEGWSEASGADYMIVRKSAKSGFDVGIGIHIFGKNIPQVGKARLKATYTAGWNVNAKVLGRYATLMVGSLVLEAAVASGEPTRIASWTGGDFQDFVNTQLTVQVRAWRTEADNLDRKYFPKKTAVGVLRI